jgi:hypothetical protein
VAAASLATPFEPWQAAGELPLLGPIATTSPGEAPVQLYGSAGRLLRQLRFQPIDGFESVNLHALDGPAIRTNA